MSNNPEPPRDETESGQDMGVGDAMGGSNSAAQTPSDKHEQVRESNSTVTELDSGTEIETEDINTVQEAANYAARLIDHGMLEFANCSLELFTPPEKTFDSHTDSEFRELVNVILEKTESPAERQSQVNGSTTSEQGGLFDPAKHTHWRELWDEYDFAVDDVLSRTQLVGALAASDVTRYSESSAGSVIQTGIEHGCIKGIQPEIPDEVQPMVSSEYEDPVLKFTLATS